MYNTLLFDLDGTLTDPFQRFYGFLEDTQVLDVYFIVGENRKNLVSFCDNLRKKR